MSNDTNQGCGGCEAGQEHDGESLTRPTTVSVPTLTGSGVQVPRSTAKPVGEPPGDTMKRPRMFENMTDKTYQVAMLNNHVSSVERQILALQNAMLNRGMITTKELADATEQATQTTQKREEYGNMMAFAFLSNRITQLDISMNALLSVVKRRGLITEQELLASLAEVNKQFDEAIRKASGPTQQPQPMLDLTHMKDPRKAPRQ